MRHLTFYLVSMHKLKIRELEIRSISIAFNKYSLIILSNINKQITGIVPMLNRGLKSTITKEKLVFNENKINYFKIWN